MSEMLQSTYFSSPSTEVNSVDILPKSTILDIAKKYDYEPSNELDAAYAACVTADPNMLDDEMTKYVELYKNQCFTIDKLRSGKEDDLNAGLDLVLCSIYIQRHSHGYADTLLRGVIESASHSNSTEHLELLLQCHDYLYEQMRLQYEQNKMAAGQTFTAA